MRLPLRWGLPLAAAAILLVTTGGRQTIGLFFAPLDEATGLGIVGISLAVAIGQFVWGATQPFFGAVADRFGPGRVIVLGAVLLALGTAAIPFVHTEGELIAALGILSATAAGPMTTLWAQLRIAAAEPSYWLLHLGFFTCGFHVAFLVTHLPGEVRLCGLPASISANALAIIGLANIAGSLGAGWLGNRVRMKHLLFWLYLSRAVAVLLYLMAPKTALTFYVFAGVLGVTWLSTVPPTAGLVGKLFGVRYLATLFGLTLLSHQLGGFYGAWLGRLAVANFGDYGWMWYADALLATMAALTNLPIREARVVRAPAVAAAE